MDYVRTGNFSLSNIGFFRQEQRKEADGATLGRYLLSTLPFYSLATIGKVILGLGAESFLFLHSPVYVLSWRETVKYFSITLKVSSDDKVVSLGE